MSPCHFQHRRERRAYRAVFQVSIDEINRQESASHSYVQPEPMLRLRSEEANGWPFQSFLCILRISELRGNPGTPLSSYVYSLSQSDTPCIQRPLIRPRQTARTFHPSFTMNKPGARVVPI
jgi:hypothetical protein